MSILDNFEVIETITGAPNISITKSGIAFSKAALEKLKCPEYVVALIDKQGRRIAIVPCEKNDKGSRSFYKAGRDTSKGVRWNNYDLKTILTNLMSWNLDECGWKIVGEYSDDDNALVFDLNTAESISR